VPGKLVKLPGIGSFNTRINTPGMDTELSWSLLSLPLYMVSELKRLIDDLQMNEKQG